MIKSSYKKVTLKEIVSDMHQGINTAADKVEYVSSGMPIIQSRNFTSGALDLSETKFIGIEDMERYGEKYKPRKGDVLFSNIGTVGKSLVIVADSDFLFAWNVFLIRPKSTELYSPYLQHYLNYLQAINFYERWFTGGTVKFLNKKTIADFEIPLPPLAEQEKIAAILDAADSLRQKDQQLVERYTALSQSLFLEMFGDPVTNPMGWENHEFGSIGDLDRGKSKHRPRNDPELLGGDYPLIQTGDVANCDGHIKHFSSTYSEIGLRQSKMWKAGTLCITIAANIAKTGILDFDACFPDSVVGFTPNKKTNIEYVQRWLSFLQKILEDSAPMAAQKNINLKILRELLVPLPPIELQNQFAERIQLIEDQKQQAQLSLEKSEALFNSLLQRAFTGELTAKMAA